MDISFTNVLEGARQYFQGLPATSNAAGGPTVTASVAQQQAPTQKTQQQKDNDGSVHSEQHSAVPYWDQQQNEGQGASLPNRDVMNTSRTLPTNPSNNYANNNNYAPTTATSTAGKNPSYSNYPATSSQVSHLYQSHIPSSSSYYELPAQSQKPSYVNTSMAQPSHNHHLSDASNGSRPYNYQSHSYPNYSQQNTATNSSLSSMSSSSQQHHAVNQQYNNYKAYNHQQPAASRSQPSAYQTNYYQQGNVQQQRTSHQLPVVPPTIYHNRNNTATKPISHQPTIVNSTNYQSKPIIQTTPSTQNQNIPQRMQQMQNGVPYSDQYNNYYQNTSNTKYTHSTTTTTYSNQYARATTSYVDSRTNLQRPTGQKQPSLQQLSQQQTQSKYVNTSAPPAQVLTTITKQKRESPLDLSVKTVKTTADSTFSDYDDRNYRVNSLNNRYDPSIVNQYHAVRAPKVDFSPNFNMPPNGNLQARDESVKKAINKPNYYGYTTTTSTNTTNSNIREALPRIDFPSLTKVMTPDYHRKRPGELSHSAIPEKMPKVDTWRQTIDKQIEQRISSYTKSQMEQQQEIKPKSINGNVHTQLPQNKVNTYSGDIHHQHNRFSNTTNSNNELKLHSNSYQYPAQYPQHPASHHPVYNQSSYPHHMKPNRMPASSIPHIPNNNKQTTANKKVLSLLRNSLQIKGAKEAQKKIEQQQQHQQQLQQHQHQQMYQYPPHHNPHEHIYRQNYREIQQPSTDVMAPLQPKPGIVGRRNVSPFTAASLERNSNTPPAYKLHIPKAIDSVIFSDSEKEASLGQQTPTTDLDGLAAFLAARIRTKAELKQVGPMTTDQSINNNTFAASNTNTPPKLKKENSNSNIVTPKKLFSRENSDITADKVNKRSEFGGIRSSSETSVFDFPDSDNETDMPVLERESLVRMRKDRKTIPTQFTQLSTEDQENEIPISPFDLIFSQTCDKFMEQLKNGCGKKRGRRKKMKKEEEEEEDKQETQIKVEENKDDDIEKSDINEVKVKEEVIDESECKDNDKDKSDCDSDTPLVNIVSKNKLKNNKLVVKQENIDREDDIVSSDSEVEGVAKNIRTRKKKVEAASNVENISASESSNRDFLDLKLPIKIGKPGKKPVFGDGSDFHPGWEEELYKYKKSLRMPRMLIHVTRPPNCQRLSTSLPDLDPCPMSPAQSSDADFKRKSFKAESIDSDLDSNCSFSFAKMNYDSEEGSSSVKSVNTKINILDKLLQRYGGKKRKRVKKIDEGPKIIPKSDNAVELLPTPSLEIEKEDTIVKSESALLGFRKKTVDNFKDAFLNNTNTIVGVNEFTAVVLKSRTRTETRVLKEKATIREVFGEDRPASAPPVTCLDAIKPDDDENHTKGKENLNSKKQTPSEKLSTLLTRNFNDAFYKVLENKRIKSETENNVFVKKAHIKPDTPTTPTTNTDLSNDGEVTKKRSKLRNIRRKFSSGFDYIRKKKKQQKKEDVESNELNVKPKRRGIPAKATPESVQDIQKEIKMWVLNKGVGETHLHRASRSGFTDITAYCLEKMACNPTPKDNAGYTPLHEACSKGHLDIARLLLQYGAHVSESAQGGIRPLHEAAENGYVEIVRLLLSYGADPTLATYSGITPLQLAVDEKTVTLLQQHLEDIQNKSTSPWQFQGPANCFDCPNVGFDPLQDVPEADSLPNEDDLDFEVSEQLLPNLYTLPCSETDRWVLLQDLSNALKIKSKETLLRQLKVMPSNLHRSDIVKEMKMVDFLEQARCCQFLNANEKLSTRSTKIFLVKYTEKVKRLLNIEKVIINVR